MLFEHVLLNPGNPLVMHAGRLVTPRPRTEGTPPIGMLPATSASPCCARRSAPDRASRLLPDARLVPPSHRLPPHGRRRRPGALGTPPHRPWRNRVGGATTGSSYPCALSGGELRSALDAPILQDGSSGLRFHASAKSVLALAPPVVRLECSFGHRAPPSRSVGPACRAFLWSRNHGVFRSCPRSIDDGCFCT
jgi:hypothetical protein